MALSFAGARVGAERDPRLAVALGAAGYRLTQTLAAALQLVARWQDAHAAAPYVWAVLTAALDVARRPRPAQYRSAPGCRTGLLHSPTASRGAGHSLRFVSVALLCQQPCDRGVHCDKRSHVVSELAEAGRVGHRTAQPEAGRPGLYPPQWIW